MAKKYVSPTDRTFIDASGQTVIFDTLLMTFEELLQMCREFPGQNHEEFSVFALDAWCETQEMYGVKG